MSDRELTPEEVDAAFADLVGDLELGETESDAPFALTPRGTIAVRVSEQVRMLVAGMAGAVGTNLAGDEGTVTVTSEDPLAAAELQRSVQESRVSLLTIDAIAVIESIEKAELDLEEAEAWLRVVNAWRIQILNSPSATRITNDPAAQDILNIAAAIVAALSVELP